MVYCIAIVGFTCLNFNLHRYLLYAFPPLTIIMIYALQTIFQNNKKFFINIALFSIVALYFIKSNTFMFDENLSYKNIVNVNLKAVQYLEDRHLNNAPVYTNYQFMDELNKPYMGYLKTGAFTNLLKPWDKANNINNPAWCIINDPATFNFNSLPFKVKTEVVYTSSFAVTGVYKEVK